MVINQLLELAIIKDASDLHLVVGSPPLFKVNGELVGIPGTEKITPSDIEGLVYPLINEVQRKVFQENWELDFSFEFEGKSRFRANLYKQRGTLAAEFRLIPINIRSLEQLGLPATINKIATLRQGFILVTGPTGHGKSTTLAALINKINQERPVHVVTIEDPIEYVYPSGKALISQREIFSDTKSWSNALRAVLREDPDVVLIGEMRDLETISSAMTIAETGHLVLATLHTNSAAQSVDRIIDVFPENQQAQIRIQLAETIETILSQRLVPTINPGRAVAVEILFGTVAARNIIREGKTHLIDNLIQTSGEMGMTTLENSLVTLVRAGEISSDQALKFALRPELLTKLLR